MNQTKANLVALIITLLGFLQMAGYVLGSRPLRGLGAASCMAPMPKVFSDVDGLETFACDYTLHGLDGAGKPFALRITPELYGHLAGCYNRRNVYGAALSYAPRMPEALWSAVFCYGLGPTGPLRREFNLPPGAHGLSVVIVAKTKGRADTWTLRPPCIE